MMKYISKLYIKILDPKKFKFCTYYIFGTKSFQLKKKNSQYDMYISIFLTRNELHPIKFKRNFFLKIQFCNCKNSSKFFIVYVELNPTLVEYRWRGLGNDLGAQTCLKA
jgi:hypothetical protein